VGSEAMMSVTTGTFNAAFGNTSLQGTTSGSRNTGIGTNSLVKNTSADGNTGLGYGTLYENTVGSGNTAAGVYSMDANVTGNDNTAFGRHALQDNVDGSGNTSLGTESMYLGVSGSWNTAVGYQGQYNNTTGSENTSLGSRSLSGNQSGTGLLALGAGSDISGTALSNSAVIGYNARVSTSNTMSFGNGSVTKWAFGLPTTVHALQVGSNSTNGNGAYLTSGGTWTNASSRAFKDRFSEVSANEILSGLRALWIPKWSYRGTNEVHLGPMAEQFRELFGLGVPIDDSHISTVDAAGVALRAVQALLERLDESERKRAEIEVRLKCMEDMLDRVFGKSE